MTEDHATLGYLVTVGAIIKSEGRGEWGDAICAAGRKIHKYEERIAALEAALKPFASAADAYIDEAPGSHPVKEYLSRFRKAREVLGKEK